MDPAVRSHAETPPSAAGNRLSKSTSPTHSGANAILAITVSGDSMLARYCSAPSPR